MNRRLPGHTLMEKLYRSYVMRAIPSKLMGAKFAGADRFVSGMSSK